MVSSMRMIDYVISAMIFKKIKTILSCIIISLLIGQTSHDKEADKILVSGGSFFMGNDSGESQEKPSHEVIIDDFYIKKTEVTFKEYDFYCEEMTIPKPPDMGWGRGNKPVIMINYFEAKSFCEWLSNKTGKIIRLPTEAEYEYASKGANHKSQYIYSGSDNISDVACFYKNSDFKTCTVATKKPNQIGIYDMSGNVWEWCEDKYDKDYYKYSPKHNPKGPKFGEDIVVRGGSWGEFAYYCSVTYRGRHINPKHRYNDIGFRYVEEIITPD